MQQKFTLDPPTYIQNAVTDNTQKILVPVNMIQLKMPATLGPANTAFRVKGL